MPKLERSVVINAPIKKIFDVITDFEKYPEFIPEIREVHVTKKLFKTIEATFLLDLIKVIEYSLRFKLNSPKTITWELISGTMLRHNHGSWNLEEGKHNVVEATYAIDVEPTLLIPSALLQTIISSNLPRMLENVKRRAEGMVKKRAKPVEKVSVKKTPVKKKSVKKKKSS